MAWSNLLINQYRHKPRAVAHVDMLENIHNQYIHVLNTLYTMVDIDTAEGFMLDIIAERLGITRYVSDFELIEFFGFHRYEKSKAFNEGKFYRLNTQAKQGSFLSDDELRKLIKIRIISINNKCLPDDVWRWAVLTFERENIKSITEKYHTNIIEFELVKLTNLANYIINRQPDLIPRPIGVVFKYNVENIQ